MTKPHIWMQEKIRETIPVSDFMAFSISDLNKTSILVQAPLSQNINLHGTGFAGSLYSLGTLTGWALCSYNMHVCSMNGELVLGHADIRYASPVKEDIVCMASVSQRELDIFQEDFAEKGKSKLSLEIFIGASKNAILHANFYAIRARK